MAKILRVYQVVLFICAIFFFGISIMSWASLGFTDSGGEVAYAVIGGLFFIVCGVMAILVLSKGRKSRGLVICFAITMICVFVVSIIQLILGALARGDCNNDDLPYHNFACNGAHGFWFVLSTVVLFVSAIAAAAAFNLWKHLRAEDDEDADKYVYLAESAY